MHSFPFFFKLDNSKPDSEDNTKLFFLFQQKKFLYNFDKKLFEKMHYPVSNDYQLSYFKKSKGLHTEKEYTEAHETFGNNA
jgi:cation-transporting ATPase 13A1